MSASSSRNLRRVPLGLFRDAASIATFLRGFLNPSFAHVEAIDPGQVEGVAATGAGRRHVIAFGVVPQVIPNVLSYVLLRFESDIRSAAVIGMVGGGGIGFSLWDAIRAFDEAFALVAGRRSARVALVP